MSTAPAVTRDAQATEYGNYLSARFAASEHNMKDAATYYRASLAADPDNKDLLALAFFFSASAGDVDDAAKLAERVVAAQPDDRAGRLTLAVAALHHRDYAGARKEINLSAKGPFSSLTVSLIDAWAAAGQGDKAAAEAGLAALHAQDTVDSLDLFHLALLADFVGDRPLADVSYKGAMVAGATPRVVDAFGRYLERIGETTAATALYTKAATEPGLKEIATAGLDRIKNHKKPDALIVRAEDGAAEALFGIASSLPDQASADVSILYLRLALYLRPDLDLGAVLLADRLEGLKKYDDAIAAYKMVPRGSPYWRLAAVEVALDEARLDRTDEAVATLKELTAAEPTDSEAWIALGDTYRSASKFTEASDAYDHALAMRGGAKADDWPLYFARAVAEQGTNNWSAAEIDLKKALALSPNEPTLLNYLGYTWIDQNRNIPEAVAMLEKARALKPTDGYIADSVGWAYYKLGRFADAAKALETAVELVPGDPTINDHLGDAYWRVGRKLDAKFQWSHALAFGPSDADKAVIEKKLRDGLDAGGKPN
ncbi:MAG TPA: tetratricopeptide repeat protein [Rhizomicrobium sp.]|nr:tetratricopeptide repeat protein [Rhizomicrobium sp.]